MLSQQNNGKFPAIEVQNAISGEFVTPAHGTRDMPIWRHVFKRLNSDRNVVTLRVNNLTDYIANMQRQ